MNSYYFPNINIGASLKMNHGCRSERKELEKLFGFENFRRTNFWWWWLGSHSPTTWPKPATFVGKEKCCQMKIFTSINSRHVREVTLEKRYFPQLATCFLVKFRFPVIKETPGYRHKLILIDSQWLVKTNGATFIFIEKLGKKFCLASFGPASPLPLFQCPQAWP